MKATLHLLIIIRVIGDLQGENVCLESRAVLPIVVYIDPQGSKMTCKGSTSTKKIIVIY